VVLDVLIEDWEYIEMVVALSWIIELAKMFVLICVVNKMFYFYGITCVTVEKSLCKVYIYVFVVLVNGSGFYI
jgi:hypothetical protein